MGGETAETLTLPKLAAILPCGLKRFQFRHMHGCLACKVWPAGGNEEGI
jgi:hypothetical protein